MVAKTKKYKKFSVCGLSECVQFILTRIRFVALRYPVNGRILKASSTIIIVFCL